jgi:outer membrane murein-binding lipoprotein Lpp
MLAVSGKNIIKEQTDSSKLMLFKRSAPPPPPPPPPQWEARNFFLAAVSIGGSVIASVVSVAWQQTSTLNKLSDQVSVLSSTLKDMTAVMYTKEQALKDAAIAEQKLETLRFRVEKLEKEAQEND